MDLRLKLPGSSISIPTPHILCASKPHTSHARAATFANTAWSLAALGILDFQMLEAILHAHREEASPWSMAGLSKLHQALNWLQPESVKHPNHGRWSALHDQLALAVACLSSTRLSADCPGTCALCCVTLSHQSVEEESVRSCDRLMIGQDLHLSESSCCCSHHISTMAVPCLFCLFLQCPCCVPSAC